MRYELPTRSPGTQKSYDSSFKVFRAFIVNELRDPFVRDIRRSHVMSFLEWRRSYRAKQSDGVDGVSGHTVARDRRVLGRLFNYAVSKDHLEANPCALVRAPKTDPRTPPILSPDQLEALLTACGSSPMLHFYVLLLAETGCRAYSEALALQWDDVDLAGGFLTVRSAPGRRTKSGKSRVIPMRARLRAAMQAHAARFRLAQRSPFVFAHELSTRRAVAGERIRTLRGSFTAAAKRAKLPAGFGSGRTTFGTAASRLGWPAGRVRCLCNRRWDTRQSRPRRVTATFKPSTCAPWSSRKSARLRPGPPLSRGE